MANHDILSEFSSSDISHFRKDFVQMIKVGAEIDKCYGESHRELNSIIAKFEGLLHQFNKKYKGVKIKSKKAIDHFKARVFIKESHIKDFFANSASRIPGLKSIGRSNFNQAEISDAERFAGLLDSLIDKIHVSYIDQESGTSTIAAVTDRGEKMIELLYSPAEIVNENSAGFKICAFYALKNGYDKKIDIYGDASTLGFSSLLDEVEKREWFDRFNPRFLE